MTKNYLKDVKEVRVYSVGHTGNVCLTDQNNRIIWIHHKGQPEETLVIDGSRIYGAKKAPTPEGYVDLGCGFFTRDFSTKRLQKGSRVIYGDPEWNPKFESGSETEVVNAVVILSKREWEKFSAAYREKKATYERKSKNINAEHSAIVNPGRDAIRAAEKIIHGADLQSRKAYDALGKKPDLEEKLKEMF